MPWAANSSKRRLLSQCGPSSLLIINKLVWASCMVHAFYALAASLSFLSPCRRPFPHFLVAKSFKEVELPPRHGSFLPKLVLAMKNRRPQGVHMCDTCRGWMRVHLYHHQPLDQACFKDIILIQSFDFLSCMDPLVEIVFGLHLCSC